MARKDSRNTKGRIVDAAWELFYEQGYEQTTIDEIVFIIILMAKTLCFLPYPICSIRNTKS